jgi:hypothetical protein
LYKDLAFVVGIGQGTLESNILNHIPESKRVIKDLDVRFWELVHPEI